MTNIYIVEVGFPVIFIELCRSRKQGVISTFTFRSEHGITHFFFFFISTHTKASKLHAGILLDVNRG